MTRTFYGEDGQLWRWHNRDSPPPDYPECGFAGDGCSTGKCEIGFVSFVSLFLFRILKRLLHGGRHLCCGLRCTAWYAGRGNRLLVSTAMQLYALRTHMNLFKQPLRQSTGRRLARGRRCSVCSAVKKRTWTTYPVRRRSLHLARAQCEYAGCGPAINTCYCRNSELHYTRITSMLRSELATVYAWAHVPIYCLVQSIWPCVWNFHYPLFMIVVFPSSWFRVHCWCFCNKGATHQNI